MGIILNYLGIILNYFGYYPKLFLGTGYWVLGTGYWVLGTGYCVLCTVYCASHTPAQVQANAAGNPRCWLVEGHRGEVFVAGNTSTPPTLRYSPQENRREIREGHRGEVFVAGALYPHSVSCICCAKVYYVLHNIMLLGPESCRLVFPPKSLQNNILNPQANLFF